MPRLTRDGAPPPRDLRGVPAARSRKPSDPWAPRSLEWCLCWGGGYRRGVFCLECEHCGSRGVACPEPRWYNAAVAADRVASVRYTMRRDKRTAKHGRLLTTT